MRLDTCLVPMQCTGNSGCVLLGKASSHSAALISSPPPMCSVFVFPHHRLRSLLFLRHMDIGSLTCAQICVSAVHTKGGGGGRGSGTKKSAQELTQRHRKAVPILILLLRCSLRHDLLRPPSLNMKCLAPVDWALKIKHLSIYL